MNATEKNTNPGISAKTRIWLRLGNELGIRTLIALEEENRQTEWTRYDSVRERALLAGDGGLGWDALRGSLGR